MKFFSIQAVLLVVFAVLVSSLPVPSDLSSRGMVVHTPRGAVGDAIGEIGSAVVEGLLEGSAMDDDNRGKFTSSLVSQLSAAHPEFNYVVCHTEHQANWDGVEGVDWYHDHQEFDIQIGGTIGYEIYGAKSGEFTRIGDGGFLNWAYEGNVVTSDQDGQHLVFAPP